MPLLLSDLPADALRKLFGLVGAQFPLKLACRAMREAHPDATETPLSFALQSLAHLEWARGCNYACSPTTVRRAARCGKDDIVHWLAKILRVEWDARATFAEACVGGSVDVLEFIEGEARANQAIRAAIEPPDDEASWPCTVAALHGHVHVLRWLRARDHPVGRLTVLGACKGGHVGILEELRDSRAMDDHDGVMDEAATYGRTHCALWLYEHARVPVTARAVVRASARGHVHTLKALYGLAAREGAVDTAVRRHALFHAVRGDCPACVKFCVEAVADNDEHVDPRQLMEEACARGASKVVRWLLERAIVTEVRRDDVVNAICARANRVLDVLFEFGHVPTHDPYLCEVAARSGALCALQLLRERGCVWRNSDEGRRDLATLAASRRQVKTFKWIMRFGGVPWDQTICNALMRMGSLECLSWLLRAGCPVDWRELREHGGASPSAEVQLYVSRGDRHLRRRRGAGAPAVTRARVLVARVLVARVRVATAQSRRLASPLARRPSLTRRACGMAAPAHDDHRQAGRYVLRFHTKRVEADYEGTFLTKGSSLDACCARGQLDAALTHATHATHALVTEQLRQDLEVPLPDALVTSEVATRARARFRDGLLQTSGQHLGPVLFLSDRARLNLSIARLGASINGTVVNATSGDASVPIKAIFAAPTPLGDVLGGGAAAAEAATTGAAVAAATGAASSSATSRCSRRSTLRASRSRTRTGARCRRSSRSTSPKCTASARTARARAPSPWRSSTTRRPISARPRSSRSSNPSTTRAGMSRSASYSRPRPTSPSR